jgi:hypothetical protein
LVKMPILWSDTCLGHYMKLAKNHPLHVILDMYNDVVHELTSCKLQVDDWYVVWFVCYYNHKQQPFECELYSYTIILWNPLFKSLQQMCWAFHIEDMVQHKDIL